MMVILKFFFFDTLNYILNILLCNIFDLVNVKNIFVKYADSTLLQTKNKLSLFIANYCVNNPQHLLIKYERDLCQC